MTMALRPERWPPGLAGVLHGGLEIFLACAFKFFLRGAEIGDARGDFLALLAQSVLSAALLRAAVFLFGHAKAFLFDSRVLISGGVLLESRRTRSF